MLDLLATYDPRFEIVRASSSILQGRVINSNTPGMLVSGQKPVNSSGSVANLLPIVGGKFYSFDAVISAVS